MDDIIKPAHEYAMDTIMRIGEACKQHAGVSEECDALIMDIVRVIKEGSLNITFDERFKSIVEE